MPGVEVVGRPVEFVHRGQHLADVVPKPGRADQGSRRGLGQAVGVAVLPDQAGVGAVLTGDVADQDRARQEAAVVIDRHQLVPAQALAARHAGQGGEDHLEELDLRMGVQEPARLLGIGDGARRGRQVYLGRVRGTAGMDVLEL